MPVYILIFRALPSEFRLLWVYLCQNPCSLAFFVSNSPKHLLFVYFYITHVPKESRHTGDVC